MEHFEFNTPHYYYYGLCLCLVLITHAIFFCKNRAKKLGPRLPPGPWQLPLIGSLHHVMCRLPHRAMRDLSRRHGPLMLLRICERVVIVVSSAEAAREMFKGRGTTLEQRPSSQGIGEVYSGDGALAVVFAPYGEHWRQLRQILMTELLSSRRVEAFGHIRQDEAARLVSSLASSPPGQLVNIDEMLAGFIANSTVRAVFGDRVPDRVTFLKKMMPGTEISSLFDIRDLFPSSWLVRMLPRPGSYKKERHRQEVTRLINDILLDHKKRRDAGHGNGDPEDMIDVLLRLQKEGSERLPLDPGVIKALAQEIFGAAVDTTLITLQWAMSELIANPRVMEKAQLEIRNILAGHGRVHEVALREMHYLKAVVKETLRLHPPGPLVPRLCLDNQKVQGFDVPRGTVVIINAWAISRDPKYWKDPERFMPERFEGERAFDLRGLDFEFTPFGVGRRICPGMTFAQASIQIALASLLYHFDWMLPSGVKAEEIDMTESFGLSVRRKAELHLYPIPRIPLAHE